MTQRRCGRLAANYLEDLRHAGRRLPRSAIRDLLGQIEAHLAEATDQEMSDADVLTVLGLVLLWSSPLWTTREKRIGTLIVPGGLATVLSRGFGVVGQTCSSGTEAPNTTLEALVPSAGS